MLGFTRCHNHLKKLCVSGFCICLQLYSNFDPMHITQGRVRCGLDELCGEVSDQVDLEVCFAIFHDCRFSIFVQ